MNRNIYQSIESLGLRFKSCYLHRLGENNPRKLPKKSIWIILRTISKNLKNAFKNPFFLIRKLGLGPSTGRESRQLTSFPLKGAVSWEI